VKSVGYRRVLGAEGRRFSQCNKLIDGQRIILPTSLADITLVNSHVGVLAALLGNAISERGLATEADLKDAPHEQQRAGQIGQIDVQDF
jgi:hypothetical protein